MRGTKSYLAFRGTAVFLFAFVVAGCFNPSLLVDGRSAMEMQLTREAISRAVSKLSIHEAILEGIWKIEVSSPDARDEDWIRSRLRERLVSLGVRISRDEKAELPAVSVGVQYAGSDVDNFYVGIPVTLPGTFVKIGIYQSIRECGRAALRLTFWSKEGTIIAQGLPVLGETHYTDAFFFTLFGPFSFTDLENANVGGRFTTLGADAWGNMKRAGGWIVPAGETSEGADAE